MAEGGPARQVYIALYSATSCLPSVMCRDVACLTNACTVLLRVARPSNATKSDWKYVQPKFV